MTPDPATRAVLLAAADLLETEGWTQGRLHTEGRGPRCVIGALNVMQQRYPDAQVTRATEAVYGDLAQSITWWNDTPGRTAAEVIAELRKVAG
jgi:hypothetical protein